MTMMPASIIFDLDGTLIDSAPAILAGFAAAFEEHGLAPQRPLTPDVIGPPLMETLSLLAGSSDASLLSALAESFKSNYDTSGYRATKVFPGVEDMLVDLRTRGYVLYIATNKRQAPTLKILDHLGWTTRFRAVYALDSAIPVCKSKSRLLALLLQQHSIAPDQSVYVGDRHEDGEAAQDNRLPFLLASWGYCDAVFVTDGSGFIRVDQPVQIAQVLAAVNGKGL